MGKVEYKEVKPKVRERVSDPDEYSGSFNGESTDEMKQKAAANRAMRLEAEIKSRWDFRYNEVKGMTEFRPAGNKGPYGLLNEYDLNSMIRDMRNKGVPGVSRDTIKMLIKSDFCEKFNPLKEYFQSLTTDNQDYIGKLAATVEMENAEYWPKYFRKWMIAVVANALNEDMSHCKNHTCLVLCGAQGVGKTTWLMNLCPKELQTYIISPGKMDPNNKDAMMLLAEYFLINIDEGLKTLNKVHENSLKEIITKPSVKYRRPYEAVITEYPHRASFMGSVNGTEFLMDDTGSRRFLPFEVISINWELAGKIKMSDVWAQAYRAYANGEKYWFDQEEINELTRNNDRFHVVTMEQELIQEYFEVVAPENATHFFTTSRILVYLEDRTRQRLRKRLIAVAMKKLGFDYRMRRTDDQGRTWVWGLKLKDGEEIERARENRYDRF